MRAFGKLAVIKHLNIEGAKVTKKQEASAASLRHGSGSIELWVAGNSQIDMYEYVFFSFVLLFRTNDDINPELRHPLIACFSNLRKPMTPYCS